MNMAFEIFKSLFPDEMTTAAWLWKYKDRVNQQCTYKDGRDGGQKQFVDTIDVLDPSTGEVAVFEAMPSQIKVSGIGTDVETVTIAWITKHAAVGLQYHRARVSRKRPGTISEYKRWAKANNVKRRMPILSTEP